MKLRLPLLLMCITGIAFAADSDQKPAPRPRLTEAMLQQGSKDKLPAHMTKTWVPSAAAPQDMTPYPVIGGEHGMVGRSNGPTPMYRPFDWLDGGTFKKYDGTYVTLEPKLQFDEPNAGWDLLKISW
jgi:hypothetical protein